MQAFSWLSFILPYFFLPPFHSSSSSSSFSFFLSFSLAFSFILYCVFTNVNVVFVPFCSLIRYLLYQIVFSHLFCSRLFSCFSSPLFLPLMSLLISFYFPQWLLSILLPLYFHRFPLYFPCILLRLPFLFFFFRYFSSNLSRIFFIMY